MKRLLRWLVILLGSLVGLLIVAYGVLYLLSERKLDQTYPVPAVFLSAPTDAESIAEGSRLATLHGCFGGCHGKEANGAVMFDQPMIARLVAPNLPAVMRKFSDGQLAVLIRNGLRPDGHSLFVMPSEAFVALNDQDLGRIIAFLRSLPPGTGPQDGVSLGPLGRIGLVAGKFKVAAELIAENAQPPEANDDAGAHGRYLARTICGGCHNPDLSGESNPEFTAPDLRAVVAYSPQAFDRLMRTGVSMGGRDINNMKHLSLLTDAEVAAIYGYLHALGAPS